MSAAFREENIQILVLGDVNMDTLFVPIKGREAEWWQHRRPAGAWLLEEIIKEALKAIHSVCTRDKGWKHDIDVKSYGRDAANVDRKKLRSTLNKDYLDAVAILGLFPNSKNGRPGSKRSVYRVAQSLGWAHCDKEHEDKPYEVPQKKYKESLEGCLTRNIERTRGAQGAANKQDILVLHDANRDFRTLDSHLLASVLNLEYKQGKTWIIWHMIAPLLNVEDNNLWPTIKAGQEWLDRTVLVVRVECLRRLGANLPEVISLEQESENFESFMEGARKIKEDSPLKRFTEVGHIVVHFRRQGVLHYHNSRDPRTGQNTSRLETSCYFCPNVSDDPASRELGTMLGFTSILVAAIVRGITWQLLHKRDDIINGILAGIKQGVVLDHLHFLHGYQDSEDKEGNATILTQAKDPAPYERLFHNLSSLPKQGWKSDYKYYLAAVGRLKDRDSNKWSRIEYFINDRWEKADPSKTTWRTIEDYAEVIAQKIVLEGLDQVVFPKDDPPADDCPGTPPLIVTCPFEVHGKIKTAFRKEIDSFASIRLIIEKYLGATDWQSPLSIAVFGPPGSGKSFTVQQIMHNVNVDSLKRPLKYNMAQFNDPKDLETVFHKVQDEAVAGEVPLVFFDEFDAENLRWLKYFLAPMEDGEFKAGDSTYRIGRAIFVFAGGISTSWGKFYEERKDEDYFKTAKGTDFVSRLRGHLDIASINPLNGEKQSVYVASAFDTTPSLDASTSTSEVESGIVLKFRRAVLLRSLLEGHLKPIFDDNKNKVRIEQNIVHAFLNVKHYKHEARSMRAIIEMSRISHRGYFQEASLPASKQLAMHVDPDEFHDLLHKPICF